MDNYYRRLDALDRRVDDLEARLTAPAAPAPAPEDGPYVRKPTSEIPRRCRIDLMTPAELAIRNAAIAVEALAADPRLTEAVVLLGKAQDKVADFVDGKP